MTHIISGYSPGHSFRMIVNVLSCFFFMQSAAKKAEEMRRQASEQASKTRAEGTKPSVTQVRRTGDSFSPSTTPSVVSDTVSVTSKVFKIADGLGKSADSETSAKASETVPKSFQKPIIKRHLEMTATLSGSDHDSLSLKDDTIDSSASPIHNEEVFELGSPNYEYYEEIKFRDPMDMSASPPRQSDIRSLVKFPKEVQTTGSLAEEIHKGEAVHTKETSKISKRPEHRTVTIQEKAKPEVTTPKETVKPQEQEAISNLQLMQLPVQTQETLTMHAEPGREPQVVKIVRRIIRKTIIKNGVEEIEEVVEEPRMESASEGTFDDDGTTRSLVTPMYSSTDSSLSSSREVIIPSEGDRPSRISLTDSPKGKMTMQQLETATSTASPELPGSYSSSLVESTGITLPTDITRSSEGTKPTSFKIPGDELEKPEQASADKEDDDVSVVVSEKFLIEISRLKKPAKVIQTEAKPVRSEVKETVETVSPTPVTEAPTVPENNFSKKVQREKKRKKIKKGEKETPDRDNPEKDLEIAQVPDDMRSEKTEYKTPRDIPTKAVEISDKNKHEVISETDAEKPVKKEEEVELAKSMSNVTVTTEKDTKPKEDKGDVPTSKVNELKPTKAPVKVESPPKKLADREKKNESSVSEEPIGGLPKSRIDTVPASSEKIPATQIKHERESSYTVDSEKRKLVKETGTPNYVELSAPVVVGQVEKDEPLREIIPVKVVETVADKPEGVNRPVESLVTLADSEKSDVVVEVEDKSPLSPIHSPVSSVVVDRNKVADDFLQQTDDTVKKSASPEMIDISMQTSTPRDLSPSEKSKASEGMQTEYLGVDSQIQTSDGDKNVGATRNLSTQTSEEARSIPDVESRSQQTSKPESPVAKDEGTREQPKKVDESVQGTVETGDSASQTDRSRKRTPRGQKAADTTSESDADKDVPRQKEVRQKDINIDYTARGKEPFEIHVQTKVTLPPSEEGKQPKNERKRKWKEEKTIDSSSLSDSSGDVRGDAVDKQKAQPNFAETTVEVRPDTLVKVNVTPRASEVKVSVSQTAVEKPKSADASKPSKEVSPPKEVSDKDEKDVPFTEKLLRSIGINVPTPVPDKTSETAAVPEDFDPDSWRKVPESTVERIRNLRNVPRLNQYTLIEDEAPRGVNLEEYMIVLRDALKRKDTLQMQYIIIYIIENIYDWFEYEILLRKQSGAGAPGKENVRMFEVFIEELLRMKGKMKDLEKVKKEAKKSLPENEAELIERCIGGLEAEFQEMQDVAETERDNAVKTLSRWEEFLQCVTSLSMLVEESRQQMEKVIDSDSSAKKKLEELEKIEVANISLMEEASKLLKTAKSLVSEFPTQDIPSEAYTVYELTKLIENNVNIERDKLLQLLSLEDEYEQTLKEFAQIIDIAEYLVDSPITITDLQHLQDEMQKHRKFFVNLSHCRGILESLEGNLDKETRSVHSDLHRKLHDKASAILDKAAFRAQQMAMAASRWTVLEQGVKEENQWLQVAQQRVPDLQQVMSSDYDQYISLYQVIYC